MSSGLVRLRKSRALGPCDEVPAVSLRQHWGGSGVKHAWDTAKPSCGVDCKKPPLEQVFVS